MPRTQEQYDAISGSTERAYIPPLEDFAQNIAVPRKVDGEPVVAAYPYTELGTKNIVGYQLRLGHGDDKIFVPMRVVKGNLSHEWGLPYEDLLYGWDRWHHVNGSPIRYTGPMPIVGEGEKVIDVLREQFPNRLCLTNLNGAASVHLAPWHKMAPLFRETGVVLNFDNDYPGRTAGNKLLALLRREGVTQFYRFAYEEGEREGYDAADLADRWGDEFPARYEAALEPIPDGEDYDGTPLYGEPAKAAVLTEPSLDRAVWRIVGFPQLSEVDIELLAHELKQRHGVSKKAIDRDLANKRKAEEERIAAEHQRARERALRQRAEELETPNNVISPTDWPANAEEYLRTERWHGDDDQDHQSVYHYRGEFFKGDRDLGWQPVPVDDWDQTMWEWLRGSVFEVTEMDLVVAHRPVVPEKPMVEKLSYALQQKTHLKDALEVPVWVDGSMPKALVPEQRHLVLTNDGVYNARTGEHVAQKEAVFSPYRVPVFWDANDEPKEWLGFLREVFTEEAEAQIVLLQEAFGYMLTTDTSFQKAFSIRGPKRSGKGTIARVLKRFLGAQMTSVTASDLSGGFGKENLINRQVALISDMRVDNNTNFAKVAEVLLSVTGEDHQSIARKYKTNWDGTLKSRFLVLSNEPLGLRDGSATLASRFLYLVTGQSFYGKEDRGLLEKLWNEREQIFHWAMVGYQRLVANNGFTETETHKRELHSNEKAMRPIRSFVEDCCEVGPNVRVGPQTLLDAFELWAENNGVWRSYTKQTMGKEISKEYPETRTTQNSKEGGPGYERWREGMRLTKAAADEFALEQGQEKVDGQWVSPKKDPK